MSSSLFSDKSVTKALIAGSIGSAIDILVYKNNNIKATMLLGACIGGSSFIASKIAPSLPDVTNGALGTSSFYNVKTIEERILELTMSSGSSFLLSVYVFKNMRPLSVMEYIGIFAGSSIGAEYISDYIFQEKLSYLA